MGTVLFVFSCGTIAGLVLGTASAIGSFVKISGINPVISIVRKAILNKALNKKEIVKNDN